MMSVVRPSAACPPPFFLFVQTTKPHIRSTTLFTSRRTFTMSTAAPQTIPPPQADGPSGAASNSSGDSMSPNLSSSPLDSFSGIQQALPSPATGGPSAPNGYTRTTSGRENSYESSVDALAGGEDVHEHDDTDDALRRYRHGLYVYTSSRFDRFKSDLERKQQLDNRGTLASH